MTTVQEISTEFAEFRTEISQRLDSIDGVIEGLRAQIEDQAALDQLANEVRQAREQIRAVNPEDPSGDDPPEPEPTPA
jgi:prefoldin subunit 5